ncbi:MAG TPA: undecaprenyl-diphosphate phosphatase [Candidatus Agathobaculum pullistercoris]|nr:undecaprenyl-diphosphate phosphatase [uncultured Agathobaculum sp.]HIX09952.1 undecaprenyl-diphosphate phosphatase [Candidatus Agathobaculum pullistercoris]
MSIWFAALQGLVQGLTEFLPVSSSGHLVLVQALFGSGVETNYMLFNVLLHFGTLLSVVVAFWKDIKELFVEFFGWIRDGFRINGHPYRRFIVMLLITLVPMFLILPIESRMEAAFSSPLLVGLLLLVTAALLFLSEKAPKKHKTEQNASWLDALIVGIGQMFAVLPGLSRSGTTICTGLFCGFSREYAVRFAFIMSLPVVLGANILELADVIREPALMGDASIACYAVGILVSMLSGLAAIRLVKFITKRGNFRPFVVYCTLVGTVAVVASLIAMV